MSRTDDPNYRKTTLRKISLDTATLYYQIWRPVSQSNVFFLTMVKTKINQLLKIYECIYVFSQLNDLINT